MYRSWVFFLAASAATAAFAQTTEGAQTPPASVEAAPAPDDAAAKEAKPEAHPEGHVCEHGACPHHGGEHGGDHAHEGHHGHSGGPWTISFDGYLRAEFSTLWPERLFYFKMPSTENQNPYVGRNDGFVMGGARLNMRASYGEHLYARLGFDGAVTEYTSEDDVVGELDTGLKDAYARYKHLYVGRFKPPYDIEELTPEEDQLFVHRALESRGVLRHEGFATETVGFAPGRQLGVMLGGPLGVDLGELGLGYALALTNGNSGDAALNDNDLPAIWGRIELRYKPKAQRNDEEGPATFDVQEEGGHVGLSANYNEVTYGIAPNRFRDRKVGAGLDAALRLSVFDLRGQLLWMRTQHLLRFGTEGEQALGGHAQLGVRILDSGFTPAYRFAYYEPRWRTGDAVGLPADFDRVMHHTLGVRYVAKELPVRTWLEYTRSIEQGARVLDNDRIEAAVQVSFQ